MDLGACSLNEVTTMETSDETRLEIRVPALLKVAMAQAAAYLGNR